MAPELILPHDVPFLCRKSIRLSCFVLVFNMKIQMKMILRLLVVLILTNRGLCSSVENFTNTVSYIAPTNFYMFDYSHDDYPAPFTITTIIKEAALSGRTVLVNLAPAELIR